MKLYNDGLGRIPLKPNPKKEGAFERPVLTDVFNSPEMEREIARCTKLWNDWTSSLPDDVAKELEEVLENQMHTRLFGGYKGED